jgi:hypothetical protein
VPHICLDWCALFAQAVSSGSEIKGAAWRQGRTRGWKRWFRLCATFWRESIYSAPQHHDSAPGACVQHFVKYKVLLLSSARITALRVKNTTRAAAIIMMRMMPPGRIYISLCVHFSAAAAACVLLHQWAPTSSNRRQPLSTRLELTF